MNSESSQKHPHQRKLTNLLLDPVIQIRLGAANIVASLVFLVLFLGYGYTKFADFSAVIGTLTSADAEVQQMVSDYLLSVGRGAFIGSLIFGIAMLALNVYFSHKLIGPTIAFRRHIKALISGNFRVKTTLRKGDAFGEVADDLNQLSETLANSRHS